jgi:hypothetical protein
MRLAACVLLVLLAVALFAPTASSFADTGSISRDAYGAQAPRTQDPLGGPPTPTVFGIGQSTIFMAMVVMLIVAALLGVYTLVTARPIDEP